MTPQRRRSAHSVPIATAVLVLALAAGCGPGGSGRARVRDPLPPARDAPAAQALTGRILTASDSLTLPKDITLVGDKLVVLEADGAPAVQVFDERSGELLASFGRVGGGPGEYRGLWSVDPVPDTSTEFWLYDLNQSRMTEIRLIHRPSDRLADAGPTALLPDSAAVQRTLNLVSTQGAILGPFWHGREILSLGFFNGGRIGIFNADGQLQGAFGRLPPSPSGIPPEVWREAFQGRMEPSPDRSRFAVVTRMADRLDIYGADGRLIAHGQRLYGFDPPVAVSQLSPRPALATSDTLRFGYVDVATTPDRIYALFSGRVRRDYPGRANFGRTIHVFDWEGHIRQVLTLPRDALAITVDPRRHVLFAIHFDPTPSIGRYALPAGSGGARRRA